jgi:hypothetical protein
MERSKVREVLGTKYMRGIIGGFEQGAGIGGGVQLTSADAIPGLELRANALTSSKFYKRFDLESFFPNIGGSRNHADAWFSYMHRESDFFGIGPRISSDLKTNFATEQRSYQGSLYRDLAITSRVASIRRSILTVRAARSLPTHRSTRLLGHRRIRRDAMDSRSPFEHEDLSYGGFLNTTRVIITAGLTRGLNLRPRRFGRWAGQ